MNDDKAKIDIIEYLSRSDTWYLGGGTALLWAPTHPQWLDHLGFWDGAHYSSYEFQPIFTTTLLDEKERVLVPKFVSRKWNPAFLTQTYHVAGKIELTETKALLPNDSLISELTLKNNATIPRIIHFVMWTGQPVVLSEAEISVPDGICDGRRLSFRKGLRTEGPDDYAVTCCMGMNRDILSTCLAQSQNVPNLPRWEYTPFYEKFRDGHLPHENGADHVKPGELLYMALHTSVKLNPHARKSLVCAANIAATAQESWARLAETLRAKEPLRQSIRSWRTFFERVPYFACSDKHIQKYYWYRWYALKLRTVSKDGASPSCQWAPIHMRETRWMDTPDVAHESFLSLQQSQTGDGNYPDTLFPHTTPSHDAPPAPWARSVLAVHAIHPNTDFLKKAYDSLVKYAAYCNQALDGEESGLYDVQSHFTIGRGYLSRRTEAPSDNKEGNENDSGRRLKGVDSTVTMYCTKKALSLLARTLGRVGEAEDWEDAADCIKRAVLDRMWDPSDEMFYDIDARTLERIKVKTVTCFYPYMTDIVDERHDRGFKRHALNPEEFWTPYPVASLSRDDPAFHPEARWRGKRNHRPWNGRVWPIANCHVAEALVNAGNRADPSLISKAVELMTKFIHMRFSKDDVRFPHSYEHYNPMTGQPSLYRGLDAVQDSWMVDLMMKYVAGVLPQGNGQLVIDPLPFEIQWLRVDRVPFRGHVVGVEIEGEEVRLYVDGVLKTSGQRGEKIELDV